MTFPLRACAMLFSVLTLGAAAKTGRSYYDEATMARARDRIERFEWARQQVAEIEAGAAWFAAKPMDELWDFVPPPEQLRALNVSFGNGCPTCGKKIFRQGGHYPWEMSRDLPFKVTCPVCKESFPENDFPGWNSDSLTAEPIRSDRPTDTGAGWLGPNGTRYFFVAHHVFRQRWQRDILPGIRQLSQAYLLTGNQEYGRRAAAMLSNIAAAYPRFDYPRQAYHNGRWPAGINGRILDYIWENGVIGQLALAYDALYPVFDDPELRAFLAQRGLDDPRRVIEQNMLVTMIGDLHRGYVRGNMGMHQRAMCYAAIVFDNRDPEAGPTTDELREWIMTGAGNTEYLLWNGFYRDGHGGESSPGYSAGWCSNFYTVARLLPRLGVDIWSNPKVRKMADIGIDLFVAGTSCPSIGDCGTIFGAGRVGWSATLQGPAFTQYGDPLYARALQDIGAASRDLFDDLFDEQAVAEAAPTVEIPYETRNLGGYGLAILESGHPENRRGATMYYGHAGGGHGHRDRLTIQLMAYGIPFLTDMGYPAHWLPKNAFWTSNTISHYCVLVDRARQETFNRGSLNALADAGFVQLMDASAEQSAYPKRTSLYRRTAALVDINADASYLLDIFRVHGGGQHDYSYHGPPFPEFSVQGAEPGPVQERGTLMGEDIPFGSSSLPVGSIEQGGLLLPLRTSKDVLHDARPYAERGAEAWATYAGGNTVLTRRQDAILELDIPDIAPGKVKLFVKVHDYNAGSNTVTIALGPYETDLTWEPGGSTGYRWISTILDLPVTTDHIRMRATQIGQSWMLIEDVALSRDLDQEEPAVLDASTSGFQYLFNVRRMTPTGMWSARWTRPEDDLAMTLTVPAGGLTEVILADAEPELKPNHPDTMPYVLLRNQADPATETPQLESAFVTVTEPHRGRAQVEAVERLVPVGDTVPGALGVAVRTATHTDVLHSSLDPTTPCRWQTPFGEIQVTGYFATLSIDANGVSRACLVDGSELRLGSFRLNSPPSPQGEVVQVDHETNCITLDRQLQDPDSWLNRTVVVSNDLNQTSYTVTHATNRDGRTVLGFGTTLMLVQKGVVSQINSQTSTLTLDKLERVDGKQHQGRWLYNENRTAGRRITACRGNAFTVDAQDADLDAIFQDADGNGQVGFWISDIGPADRWQLHGTTVMRRAER